MHKLGERATNCFPKTRESNLEPNLPYHQDLPKEPRFKSTNSKTSYQTRRKGGNIKENRPQPYRDPQILPQVAKLHTEINKNHITSEEHPPTNRDQLIQKWITNFKNLRHRRKETLARKTKQATTITNPNRL